eukprot:SM000051S17566  [mRNA]  locus=s51:461206:466047:+ [translate_table: standard]
MATTSPAGAAAPAARLRGRAARRCSSRILPPPRRAVEGGPAAAPPLRRLHQARSRGEVHLDRALQLQKQGQEERLVASVGATAATRAGDPRSATRSRARALAVAAGRPAAVPCYGCGAGLQSAEPKAPGYVPTEKFELKQRHHQLQSVLCERCLQLAQGHMIPAVGGNGGYGSGPGFVSADELRAQLLHLRDHKALIVKLVDIVDFNGSFLSRVRELVGANPIILVVTKVDLLPLGSDLAVIGDWVVDAISRKKLNIIAVHLVSSKAQTGISSLAGNIYRERQGRDVYVLGAANVGKSALISALLAEMLLRDPSVQPALRHRPIQSAMPGTTLGPIRIHAFPNGGGDLVDTPGVHLHHRMAAKVNPVDLPALGPRHRLRGFVPTLASSVHPLDTSIGDDLDGGAAVEIEAGSMSADGNGLGREGCTLLWGGLVRLDILEVPTSIKFTFFGPTAVRVHSLLTADADAFYKEELGTSLIPPSASGGLAGWEGLVSSHLLSIPPPPTFRRPYGDIAVSGLGWIQVSAQPPRGGAAASPLGKVRVRVQTARGVEVFLRPSLPVGEDATRWYEFIDLGPNEDNRPPVTY